ncbi:MAG: DUF3179 domain-containing protein [Planctomycetota bacterium]|nr:MAG: DUF3179 domain-containing protein [Planctomycetota bacterium]
MYEKKSNSEISSVDGVGMTGKYRGVILQQYPSVVTTWGEWKKHYPKTKVMQGRSTGGMMGTYTGITNKRLSGLILSLDVDSKVKGYDMTSLKGKKVVNDEFNKKKIVWVGLDSYTQLVFERTAGGKTLTFEKGRNDSKGRETLTDKETKSTWLAISGECVKGKMKGKKLNLLPTTPFKSSKWSFFHPKAELKK